MRDLFVPARKPHEICEADDAAPEFGDLDKALVYRRKEAEQKHKRRSHDV